MRIRGIEWVLVAFVVAGASISPFAVSQVFAYEFAEYKLSTKQSFTVYTCDSNSAPPSGTTWMNDTGLFEQQVSKAIEKWNSTSSKSYFSIGEAAERDCTLHPDQYAENGKNEVMFAPAGMVGASDSTGFIDYRYSKSTGWLIEADIVIAWDLAQNLIQECDSDPDGPDNAMSVLLHEFGHALGLAHENSRLAILNEMAHTASYCPDYDEGSYGFYPDDQAGAAALYDYTDEFRDVASTGYELNPNYDPPDGDRQPAILTMAPENIYRFPGGSLLTRFSIANRNETSFSALSFVVVLSDMFSDPYVRNEENVHTIGGGYITGDSGYHTLTVPGTIPEDITPGDYYIAIIVDPNDAAAAYNSDTSNRTLGNETTYLAGRVRIIDGEWWSSVVSDFYTPIPYFVPLWAEL